MTNDNTDSRDTLLHLTASGELSPVNVVVLKQRQMPAGKLPRCYLTFASGVRGVEKLLLTGEITASDVTLLQSLCSRMKKGNTIAMTQKALAKVLNVNQGYLSEQLTRLRKADLIRGKGWKMCVNPRYALQGGSKHLSDAIWNYQQALNHST